ncbi:LAQU0S03e01684g1_1 [Lachancea quebecensis]|uniref:Pre-mRNA-splicing factor ISY1 n=1 Tax=Lachancea quebecensis TaxID=1654605 RepID=A0A0P1KNQ8_9SACH|nr:LAQU0S03e01684g1_1 [Lachancea quebecensis]
MSRNVDKANSVLVRFQELEAEKNGGYKDYSRFKRPTRVGSVSKLQEAQQWRRQVVSDINTKLTRMHDPSLNELQLRELNTELNDLFSEKARWERHIHRNLKGPDFSRDKSFKHAGTVLDGKRYFGRALTLPEVQQLAKNDADRRKKFQSARQRQKALQDRVRVWKKTLGPGYYGFLPGDSSSLRVPLQLTVETVKEILISKPPPHSPFIQFEEDKTQELQAEVGGQDSVTAPKKIIPQFGQLPDLKDMEEWLVERRKTQLQRRLNL